MRVRRHLPIDPDAKPIKQKTFVDPESVNPYPSPESIYPPYKITWPPDYKNIYRWRQWETDFLDVYDQENNPGGDRKYPYELLKAKSYYATRPVEFINHWLSTYDPRNAGLNKPAFMPFILFKRQVEFVKFIYECLENEQNGLVEKSRDMGATWLCAAISTHLWLFKKGVAIGWGSRKEELVDRIGDPDSILEKIRMSIMGVPLFWPIGFEPKRHLSHMRLINPENQSTITGEIGDQIGRGGRKRIFFKDESAHYEHAIKIEAALSENTRCQIDISSVSGLGTVFHNKRDAGVEWTPTSGVTRGKTNVFIMDWSEHPEKNHDWYNERRSKFESEGMLHVFNQETGRDYAGAAEGVIIPSNWVISSLDAHKKLKDGYKLEEGGMSAGLDVADFTETGDTNALSMRKGVVIKFLDEWGGHDTGQTTRKAIHAMRNFTPIECQYDAVGVGAGVKADYNRMVREKTLPKGIGFMPWNGGGSVLKPDEHVINNDKKTPLNKEYYQNLKAQAWLQIRFRFERTHRAITDNRFQWKAEDLIAIDTEEIPAHLVNKLRKELSQATMVTSSTLKVLVDKKPEGMKSPNLAESVIMNFWPMPLTRFNIDSQTLYRARLMRRRQIR